MGKTPRSSSYLAFVRAHRCAGCSRHPDEYIQAAHVRIGNGGGVGLKPSDYRAVPLCHWCHERQHRIGERTFWEEVGRDPDAIIVRLIGRYLVANGMGKVAIGALENIAEMRVPDAEPEPDTEGVRYEDDDAVKELAMQQYTEDG